MNRCEVIKSGAGRDVGDGVSGEGAERVGMMLKYDYSIAIP